MRMLFTPGKIGRLFVKNRIVMPAMHMGYCNNGLVTDDLINFYAERAKGGAGLITVGTCCIDAHGYFAMINASDDKHIDGLTNLASAVKEAGASVAAQLVHPGRYMPSFLTGIQPVSSSPIASRITREEPRELTEDEIWEIVDSFGKASIRIKKAGFDAVEILASTGYLISQFLSPITNKRKDSFGGNLQNRMRFGLEVARRVRDAVGPDFPVIFRVGGNDFMPGGNDTEVIKQFSCELEGVAIDALNVTGGWHEARIPQLTMAVPRGGFAYLARQIKEAVNIPVFASNRIVDPVLADRILVDGLADFVCIGRGLIADSEFPRKAAESRLEDIRPCIACNQGCFDSVFSGIKVTCLVNARAGRETEHTTDMLKPVDPDEVKKILVIGGGPGGMEAARVAAMRGHKVTLWEKSPKLGGQLDLAAVPPGRGEFKTLKNYLTGQMERLGVEVVLNKEASVENVLDFGADAVVVATGGVPITPPEDMLESPSAVQAWDVLSGNAQTGKRVVIVGGGAVGCETALYLARAGTMGPEMFQFLALRRAETYEHLVEMSTKGVKEVTIVEMKPSLGTDIGLSTRWTIVQDLHLYGVRSMTKTRVRKILPDGLIVEKDGREEKVPADTVVLAMGTKSSNELCEALKERVKEIYLVGDAVSPRKALDAIYEGFMAGEVL